MNKRRFRVSWESCLSSKNNPCLEKNSKSLEVKNEPLNLLMVLYRLPIKVQIEKKKWNFSWDDDALYLTSLSLRNGLNHKVNFLWIGILNHEKNFSLQEQEKISCILLEKFNCVPIFLSAEVKKKFYQGFCKGILWPVFHSSNEFVKEDGNTKVFDRNLWLVYCLVNRKFADRVIGVYQDQDLIWIHDYHLMVLPSHLRKDLPGAKIGFFFHIPWPSSEIYRQLPVRDELLRGLMSSSLLGFHLFYYVRHFLSSCVRILNLKHESQRGALKIQYGGRFVTIRVSHIGIDPVRFGEGLGHPRVSEKISKLKRDFKNKKIIGAIDDLDINKGIPLKLLAFEALLENYPVHRQKVLFIQVAIPKAETLGGVRSEIRFLVNRINEKFGNEEGVPVRYIEREINFEERIALYSVSDIFFLTPLREGLNLIPYEYIISTNERKGQLILSEFTGCSSSLSGATRINPWNIDEASKILDQTLQNDLEKIRLRHVADFKFVFQHTTKNWAESFLVDLEKNPESTHPMTKLGLGFGLTYKIEKKRESSSVQLEDFFQIYTQSKKRLFLIGYHENSKYEGSEFKKNLRNSRDSLGSIIFNLEKLSRDPRNIVFVLSGGTREYLHCTFKMGKFVGLVAENGFYYRCQKKKNWGHLDQTLDLNWIPIALETMRSYTEKTDGSFIEEKNTGLIWHFGDSDPEFGFCQANELFDHLEEILKDFEVRILWGKYCIEVEAEKISREKIIKKFLELFKEELSPDFTIFLGDQKKNRKVLEIIDQKCPKSLVFPIGLIYEEGKTFSETPQEVIDFFHTASLVSSRKTFLNWSISNRENYQNKPIRMKIPNLNLICLFWEKK